MNRRHTPTPRREQKAAAKRTTKCFDLTTVVVEQFIRKYGHMVRTEYEPHRRCADRRRTRQKCFLFAPLSSAPFACAWRFPTGYSNQHKFGIIIRLTHFVIDQSCIHVIVAVEQTTANQTNTQTVINEATGLMSTLVDACP